jgi:hypothetical protein
MTSWFAGREREICALRAGLRGGQRILTVEGPLPPGRREILALIK